MGRYAFWKFSQPRLKRRKTSRLGTSCPPWRTRASIRRSASATELSRRSISGRYSRANVVLPAPLGPAITMHRGRRLRVATCHRSLSFLA